MENPRKNCKHRAMGLMAILICSFALVASQPLTAGENGTIHIGYVATDTEDEIDGIEHIVGYFRFMYEASGDERFKTLNVTTFRIDKMGSNRSLTVMKKEVKEFTDQLPSMVIGAYDKNIDYLLPPNLPYFVSGSEALRNDVSVSTSVYHEIKCNRHSSGSNIVGLLPPLKTFLIPLQLHLNDASGGEMTVVCIVENEEDMIRFNGALLEGMPKLQIIRFIIRKRWQFDLIKNRLMEVQKLAVPDIILHTYDPSFMKMVFKAAEDLNMVSHLYRWYLTYPDMRGLPKDLKRIFNKNYSNVTGFQLIQSEILENILPDGNGGGGVDGDSMKHAIIYDAMKILAEALRSQPHERPDVGRFMDNFTDNFEGSTGKYGKILLTDPETHEPQFCRVHSPYVWMAYEGGEFNKVGNNSYFKTPNGTGNKKSIHRQNEQAPQWYRHPPVLTYKANPGVKMPVFSNQPLKVVAIDDPPMIIKTTNTVNGSATYSGVMIDYLDVYAEELNFTYEIVRLIGHDEGGGGTRHEYLIGNVWTGGIKALLEKEAVLLVGALGTTVLRAKVIDFTETTMPGVISLLSKKPKIEYDMWQFLSPFTWSMWLSIIIVTVIVSVTISILDRVDRSDPHRRVLPPRDSMYYAASLLFGGNAENDPNTVPLRLIIGAFIFFTIVVSQSYVANMAAFLTTRRSDVLPATIDELARQNAVPFGIMANGEAMSILARATEGSYVFLNSKIEEAGDKTVVNGTGKEVKAARTFFKYEDAISALKNETLVFISESPMTKYYVHKDCDLTAVDQDTDVIRYAIGVPKGALFKRELDRVISEVREEGDWEAHIMEKWYKKPECEGSGSGSSVKLQSEPLLWVEMQGLFVTLAIGAGLAITAGCIGETYRVMSLRSTL